MPYVPRTCLPGGDLFAASLSGELCERQGPPPSGGYANCNGVSFLSARGGGAAALEPLPYPFKPRRPMPPVRVFDIVQQVTFIGPDVVVASDQLTTPIPFQMLAMVGTASGNLVYIDIGIGRPDAEQRRRTMLARFRLPGGLSLAPRLVDVSDYITDPDSPPDLERRGLVRRRRTQAWGRRRWSRLHRSSPPRAARSRRSTGWARPSRPRSVAPGCPSMP